jgi:FMN phosphatase YigB (HAD superfamily)
MLIPIDDGGEVFADPQFGWNLWHRKNRDFYFACSDLYTAFLKGNFMVTTSNLFMTAAAAERVGNFAPLRYLHDYDYIFRMMLAFPGGVSYLADEQLLQYRIHCGNTLGEAAIIGREQDQQLISRYLKAKLPAEYHSYLQAGADRLIELGNELHEVRVLLNPDQPLGVRPALATLLESLKVWIGKKTSALAGAGRGKGQAMKAITHFTLAKLRAAAEAQLADRDVVSFDIFDTLLIRRIHDPDLVKLPVARYISALAKARGKVFSWRQVQERRDAIERRHRLATAEKFVDHEACYPRFIDELLREIFAESYQPQLLELVTDYEMAMENSMLVPRQEFVEWLPRLRDSGKRLLAISDMYLPADHLQRLLIHAGIADQFTAVFSSADTFLAKASGLAYPLIAEKLQITPSRWLHIGDNPVSDGLRAIEAGLAALLLDDVGERQRRSIVKRYYNYSDGRPFWRGRVLQQLMAPLEAENRQVPPLYIEGYNFVGPLVGLFVQQIAEICRQEGIGKVFFLSREGWTFKRYWEEAMPLLYPDGGLPAIEYLYASRMALAGAACAWQGLTQTNADIAFLPAGNRDFTDLCRIFSLDSTRFTELLAAHGLTRDTVLSPYP